jgi:Rhs element Vgr protein
MDVLASLPPGVEPAKDVVSQKVFINGTELNGETPLAQITVNKSFNKVSFAKMIFLDGSSSDQDFPLSNDDKFKPGSTIKVQLGYHEEVDTVFEGIIVKHAIKVRAHASSLLMIEAKDKAIKLTTTRKSAYHNDKTDSEVIEELALAIKLDKDVTPTELKHAQLVQYDSTDWDFIVTRAEANGMLVLTDDGKLIVKKPSTDASPAVTFTYGKDIWELEAEMDARRQVQQVNSHSWDFVNQKMTDPKTGEASFSETGNLSSKDLGDVLGAKFLLNHSGYVEQKQLESWSNAYALRNKLSKAAGRVRIEGNAALKPGDVIKLAGVGDRFNGNVFVTGILHHYEGHWQTDIQFGWRDEWFYKKENVMDKPAAGLLPGINGLQIGVVVDVNDTEKKEFRVKVHVPTITPKNEGIWARVATLDAGKDRGTYFRPVKGDEVVLGFLNDDPRDPIILGCLHSKDNHASPLPEGKLQFGFVTKEGLKLVFDDTAKKITLLVPGTPGDQTITIDGKSIELKDGNQNSIKMDATGITIDSRKQVVIKGKPVRIN